MAEYPKTKLHDMVANDPIETRVEHSLDAECQCRWATPSALRVRQ